VGVFLRAASRIFPVMHCRMKNFSTVLGPRGPPGNGPAHRSTTSVRMIGMIGTTIGPLFGAKIGAMIGALIRAMYDWRYDLIHDWGYVLGHERGYDWAYGWDYG